MSLRATVLGSLLTGCSAANWAVLAAGSKTYENYRHQADLCGAYHLLRSKGFAPEKIIAMAYDDIAKNEENPFPGQIFNEPDGDDVYAGCELDYTGSAVTAANFANVLLGNGTSSGNGRVLESTEDDNVFLFYVDHGAPGIIQFPGDDVMHTQEFQTVLTQMHSKKMFGKLVVYMEACESGSMLEGLPTNLGIYGVTAVGPDVPSLGTYCGAEAQVNGTSLGTCLGDLFAVRWMKFIEEGDGSATMQKFFSSVADDVASYAALHYGHEENQQYGDLSVAELKTADFFYPRTALAYSRKPPAFRTPKSVFSAPRLDMDRRTFIYSEASAMPTYRGKKHAHEMKKASKRLQLLASIQDETQDTYWRLVEAALPDSDSAQEKLWQQKQRPKNPACEIAGHDALVQHCKGKIDMVSSFALQFHQVLVNLCAHEDLGWTKDPSKAIAAAQAACTDVGSSADILI